jgi:outer membrane protein assembly factor BamD
VLDILDSGGDNLIASILISAYLALTATAGAQRDVHIFPIEDKPGTADNANEIAANQRAGNHMEVARYYVGRGDYAAGLYRLKIIVTEFSTSEHVEEALARQTETYLALGMVSQARAAAAVLARKFPGGRWSTRAQDALNSAGVEPEHKRP